MPDYRGYLAQPELQVGELHVRFGNEANVSPTHSPCIRLRAQTFVVMLPRELAASSARPRWPTEKIVARRREYSRM